MFCFGTFIFYKIGFYKLLQADILIFIEKNILNLEFYLKPTRTYLKVYNKIY